MYLLIVFVICVEWLVFVFVWVCYESLCGQVQNGGVKFFVFVIIFDFDDMLWLFVFIGVCIDQVLYDWMCEYSFVIVVMYLVVVMWELCECFFYDNLQLYYDLSVLCWLILCEVLENSGVDFVLLELVYEVFYVVCNQVEFYFDVLDVLVWIVVKVLVVVFSNGNVDLQCIGLVYYFSFQFGLCEYGVVKFVVSIFYVVCDCLGVLLVYVLYVGDYVDMDVVGVMQVGLCGCWINCVEYIWNYFLLQFDLQFDILIGLVDWLDVDVFVLNV